MTKPPRLLIWTRGRSDWSSDAKLLAASPVAYEHLPCVRLTPLPLSAMARQMLQQEAAGQRAFVFTSAHAVDFALTHPECKAALSSDQALLFAIGEGTLAALKRNGLAALVPAGVPGGQDLAAYLVQQAPPGLTFILPGPEQRAFDLQKALARPSEPSPLVIDLYRNDEGLYAGAGGAELSGPAKQSFLEARRGVVCFASPSAVRGFAADVSRTVLAANFFPVCIGTTTAKACGAYFEQVAIARHPDLSELCRSAREILQILAHEDEHGLH